MCICTENQPSTDNALCMEENRAECDIAIEAKSIHASITMYLQLSIGVYHRYVYIQTSKGPSSMQCNAWLQLRPGRNVFATHLRC